MDDTEVINFLLSTEIIPLCLRTMEMGSELSKTVATFIVQKILLDNVGLNYICATAERFFAVGAVLGNMVGALGGEFWLWCSLDHEPLGLAAHRCRCQTCTGQVTKAAHGSGASRCCACHLCQCFWLPEMHIMVLNNFSQQVSVLKCLRLRLCAGGPAGGAAERAAAEAHSTVLPAAVGQPAGARGTAPVPA